MLHTFWLVQGIAAKNWYTTESFDDTHNSVLSDWQTVDRLLTYCGEVNLVKCKDGYFTKSVVTKAMTVANPYYTATKIEVKPLEVKEVKPMTLNQIKQEIAALLNVDVVCSDEVRQVLNTELSNTELSKSNWKLKATWQAALTILNNAGYDRTGVNESLGSQCGGSLQPTLINDSEAPINDSSNDSESIWNYKIIQSSWHPDYYHMWMYEGEKDYWYFRTDNMATEIKLQDLETKVSKLNSLASTKSVVTQSCGTWSNIFTCNDMELEKLLNSQYYQLNRDNIMQRSLVVAEIHPQAVKQQQLLKEWQLEQDNIVATVTSDNKFKGISVEHFNFKHEAYIDSVLKDTSGVLISKYLGTYAVSFNDGEQRKSDVSLLEAIKLASEWLGVKKQQVPSSEQAIQPSNLERQQIIKENLNYRKQRQAIKRKLNRLEHKSIYA